MAGYLLAYFNFSAGKAFPSPHLVDIRGSSGPLSVLPFPVPAFFLCSLPLCELCCCSALTAMVTSNSHGHLIQHRSAGESVCVWMCQGRRGSILPLPPFISRFKAFHCSCWEEAGRLSVGQESPILLPVLGLGMLSCSPSPAPASAAARRGKNEAGTS